MKEYLIVDSNIIFSCFLNIDSKISRIILENNKYIFISPKYALDEILKYKSKIIKLGNLSEQKFIEIYNLIFNRIIIIEHKIISIEKYDIAIEICKDIDPADTAFVAFALFFNCKLWTGDKKLVNGLTKKNYDIAISTNALLV